MTKRKNDARYDKWAADYNRTMLIENQRKAEAKVCQRMETGGYHRPGSQKKIGG